MFSFRRLRDASAAGILLLCLSCGFASLAQAQATTEPYHIGVWYFTLWNRATTTPQIERGRRLYGRADPWVGVRDYAEGHGAVPMIDAATGKPENFAARRPLLGFYDLMSQSIVDAEIEEAASAGIEFFAFYWYIDIHTGQMLDASAPVPKFFASPVSDRVKLLLAPIVFGKPGEKMTLATWQSTVVPQLVGYMASPTYYRAGGRPVLIDFSLPFATVEEKVQAYRELRLAAERRLHVDPLILYMLGPDKIYQHKTYVEAKLHPDGFTCFQFYLSEPVEPYQEMSNAWVPHLLSQITPPNGVPNPNLIYVPCGSIGQDPRPWYGIDARAATRPYVVGNTPAAFEDHLRDLKAFVDSGKVDTMNTLVLYAWNEWGEGGTIEPSKVAGYAYVDAIRRVFGLIPRSPRPAIGSAPAPAAEK